ncbi:hypothetical protein PPL_09512 [Heterostelium album PN500]|uniref:Uncharacterized protein n=1 Tax=Heterostelium pallidum (strain ATCC 26659 / Pp 5 / PN500) TaxID=670386 RepID=D3BNA1_HETP5|nr:hypothetical protein PPL_09512 [Heterostelium album PN500]EFA76761.1 hypothetical protein PPL_09512 [Heterostelium album PN500]|eukprot:XP_020428893.1 hypothetical protein PPL_09512 [Heterostelium album PN500]
MRPEQQNISRSLLDFTKISIMFYELGQSYIWLTSYPFGTKSCDVQPNLISSFVNGQCYSDGIASFKYLISGNTYKIENFKDKACAQSSFIGLAATSGNCIAGVFKTEVKSTFVTPSVGFIYYERYP